jgi:hypothetical protein
MRILDGKKLDPDPQHWFGLLLFLVFEAQFLSFGVHLLAPVRGMSDKFDVQIVAQHQESEGSGMWKCLWNHKRYYQNLLFQTFKC